MVIRSIYEDTCWILDGCIKGLSDNCISDVHMAYCNDRDARNNMDALQTLRFINCHAASEVERVPITIYYEGVRSKKLGSITMHCANRENVTWQAVLENLQFAGVISTSTLSEKGDPDSQPVAFYKKYRDKPWTGPITRHQTLHQIELELIEDLKSDEPGKHNNIAFYVNYSEYLGDERPHGIDGLIDDEKLDIIDEPIVVKGVVTEDFPARIPKNSPGADNGIHRIGAAGLEIGATTSTLTGDGYVETALKLRADAREKVEEKDVDLFLEDGNEDEVQDIMDVDK